VTLNDSAIALQGESRLMSVHYLSIRDTTVIMLAPISGDQDTSKTLKG
jgi:hypothetical protein